MYAGALLSDWFKRGPVDEACHNIADRGGALMTTLVRAKTPMRTGRLKLSWMRKLTVATITPRGIAWESGTETDVEYAPYIEHGWGLYHEPDPHTAYEIKPRDPNGWLSWIDPATGQRVFAKRVLHPGGHAHHMVAIGVALTEAAFNEFADHEIRRWARHTESQNHSFVVIRGRL